MNAPLKKSKPSKLQQEVAAAMSPVVTPEQEALLLNAANHAPAPLPGIASIQQIPIGQLFESPTNPRKTFANMDKLIASVKATGGIIVPLIVRKSKDGFEVVAGARRLRAGKKAELKALPCDVRDLDDTQVLEIQITENLQREDISDLDEAEAFEFMQAAHGYSVEQIAEKFGVSLGTVYARLKLRSLAKEAREALAEVDEAGQPKLPPSVAVPLARIPSATLQVKALKAIEGMTAREAIKYLQEEFCQSLRGAPFDLKDLALSPEAGACVGCPKNSATATPGEFDDMPAKGGAFCTDTGCYRLKCAANWKAIAAEAKKNGADVLDLDEGARLFMYGGNLGHGSKWIELDAPNHGDPKKRSFREFFERLPEDKRPKLTIAPDRTQRARELVEGSALIAAVAAQPNPPKWATAEQEAKEAKKEERAEAREDRAAKELQQRVTVAVVQKIGSKLKRLDEPTMRFILLGLADRWMPQGVIDAIGCEDRAGYEKLIAKGDAGELAAALLCWGAFNGEIVEADGDGYAEPLKKLAKHHDVEIKAIEKATEAGDEAEALMTSKKKKDAA